MNFNPSNSILVTLKKGLTQKLKTSREAVAQMLLTTPFKPQPSNYVYISIHVCGIKPWMPFQKVGFIEIYSKRF